jgi:DNA-binding transcriptional MerR regulator
MPPATITAFQDHGRAALTVEQDVDAAQQIMDELREVGIEMKQVTDALEAEGVALFKTSFEQVLKSLDEKRRRLAQEQAEQGNPKAAEAAKSSGHSADVAGASN